MGVLFHEALVVEAEVVNHRKEPLIEAWIGFNESTCKPQHLAR